MARPVGRPAYDTRQKLIAAMRELLSERGYAATSPKMVLERARLGQGSLYYHFTGKEQLAVVTIQTLMDRSLRFVNTRLNDDSNNDRSQVARAEGALSGLFATRDGAALVRLLADPVATQPGPLADAITVWVKALQMLLGQALSTEKHKEAIDEEEVRVPIAAKPTPNVLLASALGAALLRIGTLEP